MIGILVSIPNILEYLARFMITFYAKSQGSLYTQVIILKKVKNHALLVTICTIHK